MAFCFVVAAVLMWLIADVDGRAVPEPLKTFMIFLFAAKAGLWIVVGVHLAADNGRWLI